MNIIFHSDNFKTKSEPDSVAVIFQRLSQTPLQPRRVLARGEFGGFDSLRRISGGENVQAAFRVSTAVRGGREGCGQRVHGGWRGKGRGYTDFAVVERKSEFPPRREGNNSKSMQF